MNAKLDSRCNNRINFSVKIDFNIKVNAIEKKNRILVGVIIIFYVFVRDSTYTPILTTCLIESHKH